MEHQIVHSEDSVETYNSLLTAAEVALTALLGHHEMALSELRSLGFHGAALSGLTFDSDSIAKAINDVKEAKRLIEDAIALLPDVQSDD